MGDLADLLIGDTSSGPGGSSSWMWGVVTSTTPLRVRLDGDTDELDITPTTLAVVTTGDRVWCQLYGADTRKQLIVLGKVV